MKKRLFSVRAVVVLPFFLVLSILIVSLSYIWNREYHAFVQQQSEKILGTIMDNVSERLSRVLEEPNRLNMIVSNEIEAKQLYNNSDVQQVERYVYQVFGRMQHEYPQISAVSYGDERGHFVGYRAADDSDAIDLMLQDARTNNKLIIYRGHTMDAEESAVIEQYNPRVRPWYLPVKQKNSQVWTEIYVNNDEKQETTISTSMPVYNDNRELQGVTTIDVKLNGLNEFLANEKNRGNGAIYIIDEDGKLVANSAREAIGQLIEGSTTVMDRKLATESSNVLIQQSAEQFIAQQQALNSHFSLTVNGEKMFALVTQPTQFKALKWRVVAVVPEKQLVGNIQEQQATFMIIAIVVTLIGLAIGWLVLSRVTRPIATATQIAVQLAEGEWEQTEDVAPSSIKETAALMKAFQTMATKLKQSFQHIQESEEKYRSLVEYANDLIFSLDEQLQFVSVNSAVERQLLRSRESIIGRPLQLLMSDDVDYRLWQMMTKRAIDELSVVRFEQTYKVARDETWHWQVSIVPVYDQEQRVQLLSCTVHNITELVHAHQEIETLHAQAYESLEHIVEQRTKELKNAMTELVEKEKMASLGSLVSGVAHEINTPLGVAVSATSFMQSMNTAIQQKLVQNQLSKQQLLDYMRDVDETTEILTNNLNRAAELIKSFKAISVHQSVEMKTRFNLYDYIEMILISLKHEYKNKEHEFVVHVSRQLEIDSYPGVFSQVLTNLIMNSLIHGFSDGRRGRIEFDAVVTEQERLTFTYRDNGIGIKQEHIKKVFDPFFTTNRERGGSGLGLNIVYNLVTNKLQGKISCDSVVNEGVTFTIEIELARG